MKARVNVDSETRGGTELAFTFDCVDDELVGVLHKGAQTARRGVLIVVGGPQYRVGSHRQFVLLARALAGAGVPVLRFDYRGMGDAEGDFGGFENAQDDIAAAIDAFFSRCSSLEEVVLWGLCDGASAACFYGWQDSRVVGLVLLNPWVREETRAAKAKLRHYYLSRLFSSEPWLKIINGTIDFRSSFHSLAAVLRQAGSHTEVSDLDRRSEGKRGEFVQPLGTRVLDGLGRFQGPTLLILSGNDLTAAEFLDCTRESRKWRKLLADKRVTRYDLQHADHTFSRADWRVQVADWTLDWLASW